jgi:NAD(P)-dependent dehydrogenase (short-subunit alcohol dehydrogenase family)
MVQQTEKEYLMTKAAAARVVLITGGSRGIGKSLVQRFKDENWQVATCSTQKSGLLNSPADLKFECDVADPKQVEAGVQKVIDRYGKIDALINNAGLAGSNSLDPKSSDELWHRIIDVNLHGPYYFCKYASPYIPDQTGQIINLASVLALKGVSDATAYCAAKHGVLGFTRAYAQKMAPRKITVNAICPGWVATEMATDRISEIGLTVEAIAKTVPLGRMVTPEEIADFVYFLCSSPASRMITGQALTIDGGTLP